MSSCMNGSLTSKASNCASVSRYSVTMKDSIEAWTFARTVFDSLVRFWVARARKVFAVWPKSSKQAMIRCI